MEIAINAALTIVGLGMLCFGGHWLVSGGVAISKKLGISKLIIGMTVVAYGTSTPELAASIAAAGEHSAIILGNVIGSNIANIGMVIGIAAIIAPLVVKKATIKKEVPIMIGVSLLIVVLSIDGEISQYDGILLIFSLIIFTVFIYKDAKKQRKEIADEIFQKKDIYSRSLGLIAIGIVLLYVGAILTVDNAVILAQSFGLSERIIGITVIAIGTSLPELITSVIAIRRGHTDIGIGNIIGSNIYNILMIMGIGATIAGVSIASEGLISRRIGIGLVLAYFIFLTTTFFIKIL